MKRILITGATGNVGSKIIDYLTAQASGTEIIAAVRNMEQGKNKLKAYPHLSFRSFDFENADTFPTAFSNIDVLFLLRPPHISKVDQFFRPLCNAAKDSGIKKIVFLSVQGVEKSKVIPHHKIESLIQELGFSYIFVRPSYFMQNLTTTLLPEIVHEKRIVLPAGKAKFNWVDVENIGEASAALLLNFDQHQNQAYEITGTENKNFGAVANLMTEIIGEKISYKSIHPLCFYLRKRKEGLNKGFAVVMTILHFLPRFQKEPAVSDHYKLLTNKPPTTLASFLTREKEKFTSFRTD